jgi:TM2 domain-containing membrane protein YozV
MNSSASTKQINSTQEKYCSSCGEVIKKEAEICPKCGVRQIAVPMPGIKSVKSKTTAAILAIFLGGLGLHKFYLGRAVGIVYILFSWTFIPAIIGFIEGLMYLSFSGTDEEFTLKYYR